MKNSNVMSSAAAPSVGSSAVDSNRFYSMLLDARASNVSVTENMYDVSEKLLKGEKDNAKLALDQLWTLKKTLTDDQSDDTIERMISYYQEKIDVLREREENIKKVGKDTRALIEEKKKKDEELSSVKTQISDCTRELRELNSKLELLSKREDELVIAEKRLRKEITANEGQIVNGLYEIILRRPDADTEAERICAAPHKDGDTEAVERELAEFGIDAASIRKKAIADEIKNEEEQVLSNTRTLAFDAEEVMNKDEEDAPRSAAPSAAEQGARPDPIPEPVVYPKSVVRMNGKVIGEYYHDGNVVSKERRHYIYNSRFMSERLGAGMKSIKVRFNQDIYAEMIKVVEDTASRVKSNGRFHFEVSTNEILNDKNLKQLSLDLKRRAWDDAERFAIRLAAKIDALGANYEAMLQEQMERCAENA